MIENGKTYYYELTGYVSLGTHDSKLSEVSPPLAISTLASCCRLITEQKHLNLPLRSADNPLIQPRSLGKEEKLTFFQPIVEKMLADDVINLVGAPDEIEYKSSGKMANPFYFGPDTMRVEWTYTGVGKVIFSRNQYTGVIRVYKTKNNLL